MKLRVLAVVLLSLVIFAAGCKGLKATDNTPVPNSGQNAAVAPVATPGQPIITADGFIKTHREWVGQLENIVRRMDAIYGDWAGGKIKEEEFLEKLLGIRDEMKELNKKTDLLTDFNLTESEKKAANYDAVYKGYLYAGKDVTDFLEYAFGLPADQIRVKYDQMINGKYRQDMAKLKENLKMK